MDRKSNTSSKQRIAAVLVLAAGSCIGCGKPVLYHFKHYRQPMATIAESNKTYYHSSHTGKIIPKDPCGRYCEPGCFGFEPTQWTHWPEECPGNFPVQGEVIERSVSHVDGEMMQPTPAAKTVEPLANPVPTLTEPPINEVPPHVPDPPLSDPQTPPDSAIPVDIESAVPSPSDGTKVDEPTLPKSFTGGPRTTRLPKLTAPRRTPKLALSDVPKKSSERTATTKAPQDSTKPSTAEPRGRTAHHSGPPKARNLSIETAPTIKTPSEFTVTRIEMEYQIPVGMKAPDPKPIPVDKKKSTSRVETPANKVVVTKQAVKPLAVSNKNPSSLAHRLSSRAKSRSSRKSLATPPVAKTESQRQTEESRVSDDYLSAMSDSDSSMQKRFQVASSTTQKLELSKHATGKLDAVSASTNRENSSTKPTIARKVEQDAPQIASQLEKIKAKRSSTSKKQVKTPTTTPLLRRDLLSLNTPSSPKESPNADSSLAPIQKTTLHVIDDAGSNSVRFVSDKGKGSSVRLDATPKSKTVLRFSER